MKPIFYLSWLILHSLVQAASFTAVVTELEGVREDHVFRVDLASKTVATNRPISEKHIAPITKYIVKDDRRIWAGTKRFSRADDIFAQATIEGTDVLIVRREHNALLNPLKFLIAISGHPIQVSEIWVVALVDEKEIWSERLVSRDAVYRWKVLLFE